MIIPRGVSFFHDVRQWLVSARFDVLFDVGANVGQSAHILCRENPQATIYCFEPVSRAFVDLQRNVSHLPNVKTFQLAMSRAAGEANMFVGKETALSSMEVHAHGNQVESVEVSTLDDFCDEHGVGRIDFLKIDTEGHDIDVLVGASMMLAEGKVNFIQVESSFYDDNPRFVEINRFTGFLRGISYELFGIYDQMPHPTGRPTVAYMNAVFVNRKLLKEPPWK